MARAIAPVDQQGNKQVIIYDWDVGTEGDNVKGGATGAGIDKNIMDFYRFIVHDYDDGDQLLQFQSGDLHSALTGRLIRNCGILRREHSRRIPAAYDLYRQRSADSVPYKQKSTEFRRSFSVADHTDIELIGVWDSVEALGIPVPFLGTLGTTRYLFHDIEPSSIIRHARHAVSIDENREDCEPALWGKKPEIDLK
ncbi:phospholipase effector Tle1 domain-containing protein [Nitrincola sp. MINF-07-Sa-05]|uniref:phospholipase effector Tle1 domain-containing protein n=1 Tax=Nitrincola salilacus TaxID=3400273 RepID=UPI003918602A